MSALANVGSYHFQYNRELFTFDVLFSFLSFPPFMSMTLVDLQARREAVSRVTRENVETRRTQTTNMAA